MSCRLPFRMVLTAFFFFPNVTCPVAPVGPVTPVGPVAPVGAVTYGIYLFVCPRKSAGAFEMNL